MASRLRPSVMITCDFVPEQPFYSQGFGQSHTVQRFCALKSFLQTDFIKKAPHWKIDHSDIWAQVTWSECLGYSLLSGSSVLYYVRFSIKKLVFRHPFIVSIFIERMGHRVKIKQCTEKLLYETGLKIATSYRGIPCILFFKNVSFFNFSTFNLSQYYLILVR